ncbi:MAG: AAA family ATPase, partial [Desulfatiglandales bacterium]
MFVKEFLPHIPQISCLIMCGLPASGKSTLARIISEGRGHLIVSTDMLRIRLYGEEVLDPQKAKDLSRRWQVYELMFEEAKRSADQGRGVILDG